TISLSERGDTLITAEGLSALNYYYDNCCLDTVLIRRMEDHCGRPEDTLFRDEITICCSDLNHTIMLVVQVSDCSGNTNICMISIFVDSENIEEIQCPSDITLNCSQDIFDTDITGEPIINSICHDTMDILMVYQDSGQLDSCREGTIRRKFIIRFFDGSTDSQCVQLITVENPNRLNPADIQWAADTIIPFCKSVHPDSIPSHPIVNLDSCISVNISYQDFPIRFTSDSCEVIDREWTVFSPCNNLTFKDTQEIIRVDLNRSKLTIPRDSILANGEDSCSKYVSLPDATLNGCSRFATISNSFNNGGADASGVYPLGTTSVIFIASDSCSVLRDTLTIIVRDLESPTLVCRIVFVNMPSSDSLRFTARELLTRYTDNCTSPQNIMLSFNSMNFMDTVLVIKCADLMTIPDTFYIPIYGKDAAGNIGQCNTEIIVSDPNNFCKTTLRIGDVHGIIKTTQDEFMPDVEIGLEGYGKSIVTDQNGSYHYNNIISNVAYTVVPTYNKFWKTGLSTQDIVSIQRHILGHENFTQPEEWIAADLDRNGRVTTVDINWLRKLILGKIDSVPGNYSWRFVNNLYQFMNPEAPLEELIEESTKLIGFWQDTNVSFKAIKTGDVSGASGQFNSNASARFERYDMTLEDQLVKKGEKIFMDIINGHQEYIEGFEIHMKRKFPYVKLESIEEFITSSRGETLSKELYTFNEDELIISFNFGVTRIQPNQRMLRIVWTGAHTSKLSDCLDINYKGKSEIYPMGSFGRPLNLKFVPINSIPEIIIGELVVQPNPCKDQCQIQIVLSQTSEVRLEIFDLTGRVIWRQVKIMEKGMNWWPIPNQEFRTTGTFLYRIATQNENFEGKLVFAK
ncbi:MAG: T9SS type A sorting domain-containing protein, partial [Bacteroidota bacterium]|nr:T9SS type A sorting domain-containing protein [Bacteroidota bacterium]